MVDFLNWVSTINPKTIATIKTFFFAVIIFIVLDLILEFVKGKLLKRAKRKKQISNIEIFSRVIRYMIIIIMVLFVLFSYAGSWTGFGLSLGLFSAALGWALQRPITGIAGWIMVITKRPFDIGDRIIIGNVRGDVVDITLTHIYVSEVGGIIGGEENSGRIIMIPNSKLFEQDIINYTMENDFVLDQVAVNVTYEGNLDKAIKIFLESAEKFTKKFRNDKTEKPYTRTYFSPHGINLQVRYHIPAKDMQKVSSTITKEIYEKIKQEKDVSIAYPHTEVILKNN